MHTALECEVTIKPRFVYIPSPRTGPMRGGGCESRDGGGRVEKENRTGEPRLGPPGTGLLGFPQLLQSAAASLSGARGGLRVGAPDAAARVRARLPPGRGVGCVRPRPRGARDRPPPAQPCPRRLAGERAAVRGLRARGWAGGCRRRRRRSWGPRVGGSIWRGVRGARRPAPGIPSSPSRPPLSSATGGVAEGLPGWSVGAAVPGPREANGRRRLCSGRGPARGGLASSPDQPKSRGAARGSEHCSQFFWGGGDPRTRAGPGG